MKILYLGPAAHRTHPWAGEFFAALDPSFQVEFFAPDQPAPPQFVGVDFVLDPGGSMSRPDLIEAARGAGVQLWQATTNGLDHVPVHYILECGLPLANSPGPLSAVALAEHALALMLCCAKHIPAGQASLRAGEHNQIINADLDGSVLGVIGLGASGRALAWRARAFNMHVLAVDAAPVPPAVLADLGVEACSGPDALPAVLAQADYVSLHTPLTARTRHMINHQALAQMKPSAVLVNIARGGLVDERALIDALRAGRLRAAGLDVFETEPPDPANPLLHMDNVIATPHRAGVTYGTAHLRGRAAAENAARVAQGLPPLYLVNAAG